VGGGLRFLVFDELHTYRGRQGADVAMLVRRLKERCAALDLVQIGTSATMISRPDATALERRQSVADFATRFFGHRFSPEQVVEETLAPFTEGGPPRVEELRGALEAPLPDDLASLRRHPLMRWIEYELGVEREPDGSLKRRVPSPLTEAARRLSEVTGLDQERCSRAVRELLVHGSSFVSEDGTRAVAFKLHQFVAQGRTLYSTLESRDKREFSLDGQVQPGEGKLFFPVKFCRQCGQDYYHVLELEGRYLPHPVGAEPEEEAGPQQARLFPHEAAGKALKGAVILDGVSFPFLDNLNGLRDLIPPGRRVKDNYPDLSEMGFGPFRHVTLGSAHKRL
jgi:hypothetical protein